MQYAQIMADIKEAMKEKNITKRDVLKQVQAKAQAEAKETKQDISDEIVISAINKELKQLNQTKDAVASKPDSDLYKTTVEKIDILNSYLPKQMSEDEITQIVKNMVLEHPSEPKGKLTGMIMKELKGKANNSLIKSCIDNIIK